MFGAIDVGTNSVRLLIAECENNKINYVYKDLKTTRLGEGLQSNVLQEKAIDRTVQALEDFLKILDQFKITKVRAIATSAAREAINGDTLVKKALSRGLKIEIISGEEEAWLSFRGATSAWPGVPHQVVIDIGGGSTEIIYSDKDEIVSTSIKAGAVRCTEDTWTEGQIRKAFQSVIERISSLSERMLIGVGGTITSLASIAQELTTYDYRLIQGFKLKFAKVKSIRNRLAQLPLAKRRQIPGLQPSRADIIVAGTDILLTLMSGLEEEQILVSERDLLDGIILELAEGT